MNDHERAAMDAAIASAWCEMTPQKIGSRIWQAARAYVPAPVDLCKYVYTDYEGTSRYCNGQRDQHMLIYKHAFIGVEND